MFQINQVKHYETLCETKNKIAFHIEKKWANSSKRKCPKMQDGSTCIKDAG
jgi:hypothetical protein